ncbi:MAG: tRNA (adenosine(37)-N6)-threonylcarbamoyltransferase complex dimerization subunit type 1 TsaB [Cyanobacteria bacterium P01_H01_bin.26]
MFGLALHTSTPELGISISDFDAVDRHQTWNLGRDLSSQLHGLLQDFLVPQHWQDLGFIAVCIGPGGFTGTRIGVATARTLAQQLDVPLFGISALAAVAYQTATARLSKVAKVDADRCDIAVTMPAKRGAVYGGMYRWAGETLVSTFEDTVLAARDWELKQDQWPEPVVQVRLEAGMGLAKTTPALLKLGHSQAQTGRGAPWRDVTPFYGQHPVNV